MKSLFKPSFSTVLVAFFSIILLFLALFAEVFVSRAPEVDLAQIYANPVPLAELQNLKSLRLVNKQGNFFFENTHNEGHLEGPWQMLEPQSLRVKGNVIPKIIEALNIIRVRNFHRLEPINITSFSLDNPTLTLTFTNTKDKTFEIKMGLINPIDNSAYLSLSTQNQIYQIDPIEMALESYDLVQLAESKIFALNTNALASLELYGRNGLDLKIIKKDDRWVDQNGTILSDSKVSRFFTRLEDLKSTSILDNLNSEQRIYMEKVMSSPLYSLKFISEQGVRGYLIGEMTGTMPGMDLKKGMYALSSEDKQSFVLIDKDQLRIFNIKNSDFK